jgi:Domain of unknown function (DUF5063)
VNGVAREFRRIADDYCALVEEAPQRDRLKLHEALLEILPTLYASGSALPLAEPESEELLPDRPTNEESSGSPEADVVWHWRLEYVSHWGRHAVNALAAVHEYYW